MFSFKTHLISPDQALPGREARPFSVGDEHLVLGTPIMTEPPEGYEAVVFGLGCFWGEEQTFWNVPGVWSTSVGYAGGFTKNPTYEEVCSGRTGHAEVVRVIYDPAKVSFDDLLRVFWENHDPTQGMRQGNDRGTQYRSVIYTTTPEQLEKAEASRAAYQKRMTASGYGEITTEIRPLGDYWYAEDYHQQYLVKNPFGYCPNHSTGIAYATS
ncbi:peptide-methionine (S)-S-oxide reductase MsrA [Mumia sp. zg.B53]|uniref:peptide-methionine (S)-S-oxide reductase MsrA n=1 Tax=unclassified Mumia TaxID=2621872 RepID=UPI001C6E74BF|nr:MULTISPECIES: peptide-methionine (S)-S-oxide reductase MsrA [unclassified Mumia]MBW9206888.1 peptide-methionine (S)-S-oxide reductase MsrA [Mumia sp. zg.B17]MBW9210825.1 peptide-methionine (S)-S-oxide reductase MsrA [Mumia sp. zg.B21]MBW9215390.1 peptide-methionine (S)-S-oxide reductase MsrA [Mumia sp. zg.B53]MDD9349082.1 peptide-methionine (S)-S-oxide reductase MsrA [Mumia sp.]